MYKEEELGQAREIIDALIEIAPTKEERWSEITFSQKLDRLSELIDVLRFYEGFQEESDTLRAFRPNSIFADVATGKIHFVKNGPSEKKDDQAAQKLMLPLLDYLFTHPGRGRGVLAIIKAFIRDYAPHCRQIDFQRTATGVLRIETNVRFAARELRKFGLLQFTEAEAFKTWRLSLLGILAGDHFSDQRYRQASNTPSSWWIATILQRLDLTRTTPALLARLEALAKQSSIPWAKKEPFLIRTMAAISDYRKILSQQKVLNKHQIQSLIEKLLASLNKAPEAESIVCAFDGVLTSQPNLLPDGCE